MPLDLMFFVNNLLLGVGLAMDAFSVSLANGLHEPGMHRRKVLVVAATFAFFQALMPMLGWVCVHSLLEAFNTFEPFIPYIALALLAFIGGKMLWEGFHPCVGEECELRKLSLGTLLLQGVATSIDALSVGFTLAEYDLLPAVIAVLLIGTVTFGICYGGIIIGKKFGTALSDKAAIFGGAILILIGLEIFITGIL